MKLMEIESSRMPNNTVIYIDDTNKMKNQRKISSFEIVTEMLYSLRFTIKSNLF